MTNAQQVTDSSTIAPVIMLISAVGNYKNSSRIHFLYWMLLVGLLRWMWASSHRGISTGTNNWYSLAEVNLSLFYSYSVKKTFILCSGSCWRMHYDIKDGNGQNSMTILGPCCMFDGPYTCCCETSVKILILLISVRQLFGTDGITEIGAIHKMYSGFCQELCTSARNFMYQGKLSTCCFCHHIASVPL